MVLTRQDKIWNRAAMEAGGSAPREGDAALASLLLVHGMVMNGGIDHALETLSKEEYAAGIDGFRYFGLPKVASILQRARGAMETDFERLNAEYGSLVPSDSTLVHAFQAKLIVSPGVFSPLKESHA